LHSRSEDWASSHGLVVGAPNSARHYITHAPYTLLPTAFPRSCFEQASSLQTLFNELVDRVARDDAFLREIFDQ
jgi:hypothetical protein